MNLARLDAPGARDLFSLITDRMLGALCRDDVPWRRPFHEWNVRPISAATGRPFRGVNALLLAITPFQDNRWLTAEEAERVGGCVRRREAPSLAVSWRFPRGVRGGEEQVPVLEPIELFNAEQVDLPCLPPLHHGRALTVPEQLLRAEWLVQGMPDAPRICEGCAEAWYDPLDDCVGVPYCGAFCSAQLFFGSLLHELAHSTGHMSRLGRRSLTGTCRGGLLSFDKEDLVAEIAAGFCCAEIGLDNRFFPSRFHYVEGWRKVIAADPKRIVYAAAQAQRAADRIRGVRWDL